MPRFDFVLKSTFHQYNCQELHYCVSHILCIKASSPLKPKLVSIIIIRFSTTTNNCVSMLSQSFHIYECQHMLVIKQYQTTKAVPNWKREKQCIQICQSCHHEDDLRFFVCFLLHNNPICQQGPIDLFVPMKMKCNKMCW